MHAKLWIDDGKSVHTHLAGPNCVPKTRRSQFGKFPDLLFARLGPWDEFALAQPVEGVLISKFTRGFDGAHDGLEIVIRAEIVAIDDSSVLKVAAGQANGT